MLNSITWLQFLIAITAIAAVYYAVLALLYYRTEIQTLFSGKASKESTQDSPVRSNSLVGKIREEEGAIEESTIPSDQLNLAEENRETTLLGPVADLLKELKGIIDTVAAENIDKAQSIALIKALLIRYPQLLNTKYQKSIDLFIYENGIDQFNFDLSMMEVQSLWPKS
ncbi:MAG TPA: hypothetical protein VD884_17610 [Ohtaekwangia sp.]|nr:hypothetical protein [Ohtaekwangia sp.]